MRPLLLAAAAAGALATTLVAGPASAAPTTTVQPAKLSRGADVSVPHLEGRYVVDGALRIRVKAANVRLLGTSGPAYVIGTADRSGSHGELFRLLPDGTRTSLGRAEIYTAVLSGDGQTVVSQRLLRSRATKVKVHSATTGARITSDTFKGYVSVLDAQGDRVLVGGEHKTWTWTTSTGALSVVGRGAGYAGDLSSDVVARFSKDPYRGGCTVVSRISTRAQLWRSCSERVQTFNADASRMATVGILSDGVGPAYVAVRGATGHKYGAYQVTRGWFGAIGFETPTALLLETNGARKAATVRCTDTGCERAGALRPAESPRLAS